MNELFQGKLPFIFCRSSPPFQCHSSWVITSCRSSSRRQWIFPSSSILSLHRSGRDGYAAVGPTFGRFIFLKGRDGMGKLENRFQAELIKEIKRRWPGCVVMKNDPNYIQGIPDLTILYRDRWATLECKKSKDAPARPNQPHYVETLDAMSFSAFIFPENEEEVLERLGELFG